MNKPVFENVIGEKIDIGNVLEDTLSGGAATHTSAAEVIAPLNGAPSRVSALDLLQDEKDGRRSIEVVAAAQANSYAVSEEDGRAAAAVSSATPAAEANNYVVEPEQSATSLSVKPVSNSVIDPVATDFQAAKDGVATNVSAAVSPASNDVLSSEASPAPKQESVLGVDQTSAFLSKESPSSGATAQAMTILVNGSDDPAQPDSLDFRTGYEGIGLDVRLRAGDDQVWAGGGNFSVDGGAGNDTIYGRFFYNPEGGYNGDHYWGGGGFDTVNYGFEQQDNGAHMWFDGYAANYNRLLVNGRSYVEADVEKIVGIDTQAATNTQGDAFFIRAQYDTPTRSWYWAGMRGNDDLRAGLGNDTLDGGADGDVLQGGDGNDSLYGSMGFDDGVRDILWGGAGNDRLEGNFGDILIGDSGNDTIVGGWVSYADYTYNSVVGGASYNFTYSSSASRTVNLILGTVVSGSEVDILSNVWQVSTGAGNDILIAAGSGAWFDAGAGSDQLYGGGANDTLLGGTGLDTFYGSAGSDSIDGETDGGVVDYISLSGSVRIDLANQSTVKTIGGTDTVKNINHAQGTNSADDVLGNVFANHLLGADGNDFLHGDLGNDTLEGGKGNDVLSGGGDNDSLSGGDDNDTLMGDTGADTMDGGAGDDEYWVDNSGDIVIEAASGGANDVIRTYISYDLGAKASYVENLKAEGTANIDLTGNAGSNILTGNSGKNIFEGGAGADTMKGGWGDDTYHIRDLSDVPQEFSTTIEGSDTAYIYVANFDGRKLANIENVIWMNGGSVDYAPDKPIVISGTLSINENATGVVAQVQSNDPDGVGGPLTYELLTHGDKFSIDPASGIITLETEIDFEDPPADLLTEGTRKYFLVDVRAVETSGGQYASDPTTLKIYIDNVDEAPNAPVYPGKQTWAEGTDKSVTLVQLGGSIDPEGAAVTYRLSGAADANPGGRFVVSSDGKITLADGASLDFEAPDLIPDTVNGGKYYIVKVVAFDGVNASVATDARIYVADVNEAPSVPTYSGTPTVAENDTGATPIVQLSSTDPEGQPVTYVLAPVSDANPGGRFVVSSDGKITLAPNVTLNYEASDLIPDTVNGGKYYIVKVRASDGTNTSVTKDVRIYVTNVNEAPSTPNNPGPQTWVEGTGSGITLARVQGSIDPEGQNVNYYLSDAADANPGGRFVVGLDGAISLKTGGKLDYEAPDLIYDTTNGGKYYAVKVVAKDPDSNASAERTVRIYVTNVEEAPANIRLDGGITDTVAESLQAGNVVGTLSAVDEDPGRVRYAFVDGFNGAGHFYIQGKEIRSALPLNFEEQTTTVPGAGLEKDEIGKFYRLKVVATDSGNPALSSEPQEIKVYVTDANEAPDVATANATVVIDEIADNDTVLATFTVADQDASETFTYGISGLPAWADGAFAVDAVNKTIYVADKSKLTVWKNETFTLTLTVQDSGNLVDTQDFTITIRDMEGDRAPSNITLTQSQDIPEDWGAGLFVGQLSAVDPDGDPITGFSLADPNVPFEIRQSGSDWFLVVSGPLDYETHYDPQTGKSYYEVQVTASAGGLTSTPQTVKVYISDVGPPENTAPVIALAPDGQVNWVVGDDTVLDPFQDLSFSDAEDGGNDNDPNTWIEVQIYFEGGQGTFESLPDMSQFPGATFTYLDAQITVRGTAEQVTAIVQSLHFHTRPRSELPDGMSEVTHFSVWVFDTDGAMANRELSVNALTGDVPPSNIRLDGARFDTVAESLQVGDAVGNLTAVDENPATLTYAFADGFDGAGHFVIVGNQIKVASGLNFEDAITTVPGAGLEQDATGKFYRLKVIATDDTNLPSTAQEIKVYVTNVNETPTLQIVTGGVIAETLGGGQDVAELFATDPDEGDTVSFTFAGGALISADGAFQIVGNKIVVANQQAIQVGPTGEDREYEIVTSDQHGATSSTIITIHIDDVPTGNTPPSDITLSSTTIVENSDGGTLVGILGAVDDGSQAELVFELEDASGKFEIVQAGNQWELRLKANAYLNYEEDASYDVVVTVRDTNGGAGSLSRSENFTITVLDDGLPHDQEPNDAPVNLLLDGSTQVSVDENDPSFSGTLSAYDRNGDPLTYAFANGTTTDPSGLFRIDGTQLKIVSPRGLDYETATDLGNGQKGYLVDVMVSDGRGGTSQQTFTIVVNDDGLPQDQEPNDNQVPGEIIFQGDVISVLEHLGTGLTVGFLQETDADGDHLTYTLVDDGGGRIDLINGNEIVVKDHTKIDFEQMLLPEFSFTVLVSDGVNPAVERVVKLGVENRILERVTGTPGDDQIWAGSGNDTLNGSGGNDTLSGGTGRDQLAGGAGADVFLFNSRLSTTNWDLIDFKLADNDRIWLKQSIFTALGEGSVNQPLNADAFALLDGTITDLTRIIYDQTTGDIYYDANGSAAGQRVKFAQIAGSMHPLIGAEHFFVV